MGVNTAIERVLDVTGKSPLSGAFHINTADKLKFII